MFEENTDANLSFTRGSRTFLEHVMCAEYLLAKGYLMSDLEELPSQVAKNLIAEACRFTARRLSELGFIERCQFRLSFSLN
jgi:hypothetical protein